MIDDGRLRFAYRLAAHLGKVDPVGEILGVLDSVQLIYWQAFLELEPLAADRDDVRAASLVSLLANQLNTLIQTQIVDAPDVDPFKPADLLIDWEGCSEPKPPPNPQETADALVMAINSRFRV